LTVWLHTDGCGPSEKSTLCGAAFSGETGERHVTDCPATMVTLLSLIGPVASWK
jgi:hypothetical protein